MMLATTNRVALQEYLTYDDSIDDRHELVDVG
jgi:hypothetical protein